jgi:hypothetical protein
MWQTEGLERDIFGSVAIVGLKSAFSDVWQIRKLGVRGRGAGIKPERESSDRRGCVAANMWKDSMEVSTG